MSLKSIAILHYSCPPVVGGVEEIVRQQASLFHRNYHPVKILAGMGERFTGAYEIEINPLLSSRNKKILKQHQNVLRDRGALKEQAAMVLQILQESLLSFDIVLAHNVLTMPYNLPLTLALHQMADQREKKIISWNHDSPYFYDHYKKSLDNPPWDILRTFNPNIHYVAISESRRQEFSRLYGCGDALHVIQNGIDPIRFLRLDRHSVHLIREERLFECELIMVQPSRLHPRKNIELSIRVLKALHDRGIRAKLLLTGAFDPHEKQTSLYYRKLRDLARELGVFEYLVMIAGYRFKSGGILTADRVMMRDLYQISDILFMPSKQEGFGIPLLEAGMIHLPIACTDIPPFREIGGDNVLLFSAGDSAEDIAARMLDFLTQSAPSRMFKYVIREHTWDNIYRQNLLPFIEGI